MHVLWLVMLKTMCQLWERGKYFAIMTCTGCALIGISSATKKILMNLPQSSSNLCCASIATTRLAKTFALFLLPITILKGLIKWHITVALEPGIVLITDRLKCVGSIGLITLVPIASLTTRISG